MKTGFDTAELVTIKENLLDEFKVAASGGKTSLAWALHEIKVNRADAGRVVSVGGTNLIAADVKRDGTRIALSARVDKALPLLDSLDILADSIIAVLGGYEDIGLNFAYPLAPFIRDGRIDGTLIRRVKEHGFDGLIGRPVGEELEGIIFDKTGRRVRISCANDTVCLVLAGLELSPPACLAAGVIGTGFNFGFFTEGRTVVNLESGNFSRFTPTDSAAAIDAASSDPGVQLFEKEVSGRYLHLHYNFLRAAAGAAGPDALNAAGVSAAALSGDGAALSVLKKSASLTAVEIAAIYEYKGKAALNAVIEGSLYWKGAGYRAEVDRFLLKLGVPEGAVKIFSIADSSLAGAAELIV